MKKVAIAVILSAFAATALSAPVLASKKKKKAAPGMCGTMMYFDKKTKTCKSKG